MGGHGMGLLLCGAETSKEWVQPCSWRKGPATPFSEPREALGPPVRELETERVGCSLIRAQQSAQMGQEAGGGGAGGPSLCKESAGTEASWRPRGSGGATSVAPTASLGWGDQGPLSQSTAPTWTQHVTSFLESQFPLCYIGRCLGTVIQDCAKDLGEDIQQEPAGIHALPQVGADPLQRMDPRLRARAVHSLCAQTSSQVLKEKLRAGTFPWMGPEDTACRIYCPLSTPRPCRGGDGFFYPPATVRVTVSPLRAGQGGPALCQQVQSMPAGVRPGMRAQLCPAAPK